jgi:hypothetical protein
VTGGDGARDALERVLAATPPAPSADDDPNDVARRGADMFARREPAFCELRRALELAPDALAGDGACRDLLAELQQRDAAWCAALGRARHVMGQRLVALRRLSQRRRQK